MKKWLTAGLCAMALLLLLAACSKDQQPGDSGDSLGSIIDEPATLVVTSRAGLTLQDFEKLYEPYLKEKFPHYSYEFIQQRGQNIHTRDLVVSGQPIDLMFESHFSIIDGVIEPGLGYDIEPLMKQTNVDTSRFDPVTIKAMQDLTGGKLYGLPNSMAVVVTFYNKDVFDKFGVEYPVDGMTWEEQLDLGRRVSRTEDGVQFLGLLPSTGHVLKLNPFYLPYADVETNKSTLNNENWKLIVDTILVGISQQPGFVDSVVQNNNRLLGRNEFIKNQNIAMYSFFTETVFNDGMDQFNWDMVSAPTYKEKPGIGHQNYPNYILISGTSKHKEASMEVIKFLTSDEFQLNLSKDGTISPLLSESIRSALGQNYPIPVNWGAVFYNQFSEIPPKGKYESMAERALTDLVPAIVTGTLDVNTALRNAHEAAEQAIAAEMSK